MTKNICKDCAGNPINHTAAYCAATMTYIMRPFEKWINLMGIIVDPILSKFWNPVAPAFYKFMASHNLGIIHGGPSLKDSWKIKCIWKEATKRGIEMRKFSFFKKSRGVYFAKFNGKISCFDSLPRPEGRASGALAWMDDKGLMRKRFIKSGIPVANGGMAMTKASALRIFRSLDKPVITKPNLGSRSRHTTVHIRTEEEFLEALKVAKRLSPWIIIEEELTGMVFRGTLIGGEIAAVMRREPPHIVGDGRRTILELVKKENRNPKRRGPIFHHIDMGNDAEKDMGRQRLNWDDIPKKGKVVTLGDKVGRATGASTTDVTDIIHPENIKLLQRIHSILQDPLVGIDFIMEDISKPWSEQNKNGLKCGIIECNSMPFIDLHHYPLFGKPRNVAGALWDIIFPDSKELKS